MTFETVRVEWNPAPELFILGYKVLVQNTSIRQLVAWNISSAYVEGLHSNTTYVIKVFPVHGLTVEELANENSQGIFVTTKPVQGKINVIKVLKICILFTISTNQGDSNNQNNNDQKFLKIMYEI